MAKPGVTCIFNSFWPRLCNLYIWYQGMDKLSYINGNLAKSLLKLGHVSVLTSHTLCYDYVYDCTLIPQPSAGLYRIMYGRWFEWRIVYRCHNQLLMMSQRPDASTGKVMSNSLDVDFIHGDIRDRSCNIKRILAKKPFRVATMFENLCRHWFCITNTYRRSDSIPLFENDHLGLFLLTSDS